MKRSLAAALLMMIAATALAQNNTLELLRQDLKTQKVDIMTASVPLTEKEADAFWPIYRDYDHELSKIGDRRIKVIKEIAESYQGMDVKKAESLVKESFSIAEARNSLLKKYYNKMSKAVGVLTAARFLQVENQMLTLLDAQVIDQVPLIKTGAAGKEKK